MKRYDIRGIVCHTVNSAIVLHVHTTRRQVARLYQVLRVHVEEKRVFGRQRALSHRYKNDF